MPSSETGISNPAVQGSSPCGRATYDGARSEFGPPQGGLGAHGGAHAGAQEGDPGAPPSLLTLWRQGRHDQALVEFGSDRRLVRIDDRVRAALGGRIPEWVGGREFRYWHPAAVVEALVSRVEELEAQDRKLRRLIDSSCERVRVQSLGYQPSGQSVRSLPDLVRYTLELLRPRRAAGGRRAEAGAPRGAGEVDGRLDGSRPAAVEAAR